MSDLAATGVGQATNSSELLTTGEVSYAAFKNAVITLHKQGTIGANEGDFTSLAHGLQLLSEWGNIFPHHAARLADDPEFLS